MSRSRLEAALAAARDTKRLELGRGALDRVKYLFDEEFPAKKPIIVADKQTWRVAGERVEQALKCRKLVFDDPNLYAEHSFVEQLQAQLAQYDAIPVVVGSGALNDITKLAAHRLGRQYMCVATAASMDGYTAYGASITYKGSKQTFDCPAPRAVVADIDIIEKAPREMTASGFADLLAKVTAGADWILADALGIEPIDAFAWDTVQADLRKALAIPVNVERLTEGLMMGGFAMQAHLTSRPASGAEHQFSHLWDMQHATDASHGFKVGIGTLAVAGFYEKLLAMPLDQLDIDAAAAKWQPWDAVQRRIRESFDNPEIRDKAIEETQAKWVDAATVEAQLTTLKSKWPALRPRLREHLLPASQMASMLAAAGATTDSNQIGISPKTLHDSFRLAYYIRRRFTVLDLGERVGVLP